MLKEMGTGDGDPKGESIRGIGKLAAREWSQTRNVIKVLIGERNGARATTLTSRPLNPCH